MKPIGRVAIIVMSSLALVAVLQRDELPQWRIGGSRIVLHEPLPHLGDMPVPLTGGAVVEFRGDSNLRVRGNHRAFGFPERVQQAADDRIDVRTVSLGGGGISDALHLPLAGPKPALVVLMFGSNDAASRRALADRQPVPLAQYRAGMEAEIHRHQARRARVLVLAPLPAGAQAMDRRIQPYRVAARDAASNAGADFLDPMEAFSACGDCVLLGYDALHLVPEAHVRLADWIVQRYLILPSASISRNFTEASRAAKI